LNFSFRRTRLVRVPDLQTLHQALADVIRGFDPVAAQDAAILLPTNAAAAELRRTLENILLLRGDAVALAWPALVTREDLYIRLHARAGPAVPRRLTAFEREAMLRAAAREAREGGAAPPFEPRAGLISAMLAFYDALRRLRRSIKTFEDALERDLARDADVDRGAARLLAQTRFLASAFYAYERRAEESGAVDEHRLRDRLLAVPSMRPLRHVVVTIADQHADSCGLWPADFDLLTRLPGLERVDIISTDAVLEAGGAGPAGEEASSFRSRLEELLPGVEDVRLASVASVPALIAPDSAAARFFVRRDREEELVEIARRVKRSALNHTISDRTAVVFQQPLPYLYLAKRLFESAGLPVSAADALPLAAEPCAAALDLVLSCVSAEFSRRPLVALLRSPQFAFETAEGPLGGEAVDALDRALHGARYLGGRERLAAFARERPSLTAAAVAVQIAEALAPLEAEAPPSAHVANLARFLRRHERRDLPLGLPRERPLRARAAILGALDALGDAFARFDDRPCGLDDVASAVRGWIEAHTFAPWSGAGGVGLVDADAARYGDFDELHLVGLVEGEWPGPSLRSVFYPAALLRQFGWPSERQRTTVARARFQDLLRLPRERVLVSTFSLEADSIVRPSMLLQELDDADLPIERCDAAAQVRIFREEALAHVDAATVRGVGETAWLSLRLARPAGSDGRFHGQAGPPPARVHTATAVERYLECPFKYFAADLLRLGEEREDEPGLTPQTRGQFIHDVFHRFFDAWQRQGGGAITLDNLAEAGQLFTSVAEAALARVPEGDRLPERNRLLGSAAAVGLGERVLRLEAERGASVRERRLEFALSGEFVLGADGSRVVRLSGTADRVDLLADGSLRVIDYKSGRAPRRERAIQIPVYAACVQQQLQREPGRCWTIGESGYIAFGEAQTFHPVVRSGADPELDAGQQRFLAAVDRIAAGDFPPRPLEPFRCVFCAYPSVCRKDYVGDE
jgi:CRISPR/Cas system-associated exonuclease Cas4 (RecB family)